MKRVVTMTALMLLLLSAGCVEQPNQNRVGSQPPAPVSPTATPASNTRQQSTEVAITFPVLDAFFASDELFAKELQTQVGLSDEQMQRLRAAAREETSKLREDRVGDDNGGTAVAQQLARERVGEIIGAEKASRLFAMVADRWRSGEGGTEGTKLPENVSTVPNSVPADTRVVVNIPGYRMDVFKDGQLIKSYKIGIGYPEFPLPTGMRTAKAIIFNPTWTPPDEPWVESPNSQVKVGQKVEAGSKLNPLGLLKIPIGSPSLIHGGKSPAKLGTFASHGCVGLTDALAQDFAKLLAQVSGSKLSDADIAKFKRARSETKQVTLAAPVPVELRYETIVAQDGKLFIYRDVYDRDTNSEENLRAVLQANNIRFEDLPEEERAQLLTALHEMSRNAKGTSTTRPSPSPEVKNSSRRVTRAVKGKKEIAIEIPALKGKGYPVAVSTSGTIRAKT